MLKIYPPPLVEEEEVADAEKVTLGTNQCSSVVRVLFRGTSMSIMNRRPRDVAGATGEMMRGGKAVTARGISKPGGEMVVLVKLTVRVWLVGTEGVKPEGVCAEATVDKLKARRMKKWREWEGNIVLCSDGREVSRDVDGSREEVKARGSEQKEDNEHIYLMPQSQMQYLKDKDGTRSDKESVREVLAMSGRSKEEGCANRRSMTMVYLASLGVHYRNDSGYILKSR